MRILYLAHRVPYPPNKGEKIRSFYQVRYLGEHHELHLVAFVDQPEDERSAAPLRAYCRDVQLVRLHKGVALAHGAAALALGRSLSEGYFWSPAMERAVARAGASGDFDVAWALSSPMVQYLPLVRTRWRVADFVDVDSEKWRQFAAHSPLPLRWGYALEAARLRAFERRVAEWVDRVVLTSTTEATLLRTFCAKGAAVRVLPTGIDTGRYEAAGELADNGAPAQRPTVLFTGTLDYWPNSDAVLHFARDILPLVCRQVPDVLFVAVGHRPPARLVTHVKRYAGAVSIAGSVPDVRPYFRRARVYVAPLRLGRGVQTKVLEAMAMRVPVVSSPLAVEGLAVENGKDVIVAETAEEFAAAVVALLRDPERCRHVADAAFHVVQARYDWAVSAGMLGDCLPPDAVLSSRSGQSATDSSVDTNNATGSVVEDREKIVYA